MNHHIRNFFPYVVLLLGLIALSWAMTFGKLSQADFTFNNGTEVQTVDPAKATGAPEGRILNAIFEGLLSKYPVDTPNEAGLRPMTPQPGVAEMPEISEDGKTYTFHLRPEAKWSNGRRVTADDFVFSWQRFLHPETGSRYAYQLYYMVGAEQYNTAAIEPGEQVEVELADRDELQLYPRGTIKRGILKEIVKPVKRKDEEDADWKERWVYVVDIKPITGGDVAWDAEGEAQRFSKLASGADTTRCLHILPNFETTVGLEAVDEGTLIVQLKNRTPYFNDLVSFYPLFPVNRECVEEHGVPRWTKPENIVTNGPFNVRFRRIRDRIRLEKNPTYWNADAVKLKTVDAMSVESYNTSLNMYLKGQLDWTTVVPTPMIPLLKERDDFRSSPGLITYFYRLNVDRPPLDNVLVRRALNLAINKQEIVERVTRAGQLPARSLVPPGMVGYEGALCGEYNVKKAKQLLAEAGHPGGRGLPKLQILYNTSEGHRAIAEVISQQWRQSLGVDVELRNLEWGVFLDTTHKSDYTIARAGWIADYPDPNTFLDMFVTDGPQNETNWSNEQYDRLITEAAAEPDKDKRLKILREAEEILMDELPIIPIYFYVNINLVQPHVKGFSTNLQDLHPLHLLSIEKEGSQ